ncbi:DUF1156 domain-containing protein [Actinomadura fulvescens]|uniref:DUF1156 domain-containing protein n=1 Tax=Actinomadura fulvescens TaxID=46160 RepID=A0ABP6CGF3_9ACTN
MTERPRLLIEDWLPVRELGIESRRERAAASALPPLSFLHVWWARRPLVASAGVVLAGLLPAWSPELAKTFPNASELANESAYRAWLLRLIGIWGDPIAARAKIDSANAAGVKLEGNGYGYKQAFRNSPDSEHIRLVHDVLRHTWGGELPLVADPTAGGGSIPFTAARLGIPTVANDLNDVAVSVLQAGVKIPAEHGLHLLPHLKKYGEILVDRLRERLEPFFPRPTGETVIAYIWAHSVACPRTGRPVPLVTDWMLRRDSGREIAIRFVAEEDGVALSEPRFELLRGAAAKTPDRPIMARGSAISPYDNLAIDGEYIKAEAQASRMGQILYAVAIRRADGTRDFRAPTPADLEAVSAAAEELGRVRTEWETKGFLPTEIIDPRSNYERGHRLYGIDTWAKMFTPRQLLTHGTFTEEFCQLIPQVRSDLGTNLGNSVLTELGMMQSISLNWNGRSTSWNIGRQGMRSVFDKHNFSFKWTFAEFEGASGLYPWCLYQVTDAYTKIANLYEQTRLQSASTGSPIEVERLDRQITVHQGNAANLSKVGSKSVSQVCIDPPYYDNVMYAELADYFYMWEKRTLGRIMPEFFSGDSTDKDNEAVANPARFASLGKRKKQLADADYEAKMTAIFAECDRILRDDGVLTVMFTHKRAEAWDTLGMGMLQAGFTIETSWPVHTEFENSMHQANVNAAASTIMLVCRKRENSGATRKVFFEDIEREVRQEAREALARFSVDGLTGVDLLLSTYGPALSVISRHWPVYSTEASSDGAAELLRPEQALDAARAEVVLMQRARLVGHASHLDPLTDFTMLAWDTFGAAEFPYDEARRLALAVGGLDLAELESARILAARSGKVRLLSPGERVRSGDGDQPGVRPEAERFGAVIDAVHTIMYIAELDGLSVARAMMDRLELTRDRGFLACVQGLVNAIPRTQVKGEWLYPDAQILDKLAVAYLSDIVIPQPEATEPQEQWAHDQIPGV